MDVPVCCNSAQLHFGCAVPSQLLCLDWCDIVDQMTWDGQGVYLVGLDAQRASKLEIVHLGMECCGTATVPYTAYPHPSNCHSVHYV